MQPEIDPEFMEKNEQAIREIVAKMQELGILRITYDFMLPNNDDIEVWFHHIPQGRYKVNLKVD